MFQSEPVLQRRLPTSSAPSISDAGLPAVIELRRARAALWRARSDFDAARRYAHQHPENELAWRALRLALAALERESGALALLSHSPP
jgi:hypothetical protein